MGHYFQLASKMNEAIKLAESGDFSMFTLNEASFYPDVIFDGFTIGYLNLLPIRTGGQPIFTIGRGLYHYSDRPDNWVESYVVENWFHAFIGKEYFDKAVKNAALSKKEWEDKVALLFGNMIKLSMR